ncbi:unnamed protein product [Parajaminaea phylloscopi]
MASQTTERLPFAHPIPLAPDAIVAARATSAVRQDQPSSWWDVVQERHPGFETSTPLSDLVGHFPAASTQAFIQRTEVILPSFRHAVKTLAASAVTSDRGEQHKGIEAEADLAECAKVLLTGLILQGPYVVATGPSLRPFQGEIAAAVIVLERDLPSTSSQGSKVVELLRELLTENAQSAEQTLCSNLSAILGRRVDFEVFRRRQDSDVHGGSRGDARSGQSMRSLMTKAAGQTIKLSESRQLLDGLQAVDTVSGFLSATELGDMPVQIASKNPAIGERLFLKLAAEGPAFVAIIFASLGDVLPVNATRSFDVLLKLYSRDAIVQLERQRHRQTSGEDPLTLPPPKTFATTLKVAMWTFALPTFISRSLSALLHEEDIRKKNRRQMLGDEENAEKTSEELARDVECLLAFIDSIDLYQVSTSPGVLHVGPRDNQLGTLPHSEARGIQTAAQAVMVELKSFALEMARYKEAASLLRRLTLVERAEVKTEQAR